jgi:phytanoyl-CoA hydroxylase
MAKLEIPRFTLGEKLTDEQKAFFDKHGIIQFKNFADRDTVALFLSEIKKVEAGLLAEGVDKINGIPLKFGYDIDDKKIIQRIAFTNNYSPVLAEFLKEPRLQGLIELMYPYEGRIGDVEKDGLVLNHYVRTPKTKFSQMGWHTDSPRDLFLGQKIMPMLNVGIHLDDCPYDNGGLRVLPGTHKQNVLKLLFGKRYFVDNNPDKREVGFDIEAGDLTVHDGRIWHRVQISPNYGEASRRRVMYIPFVTGKYMPKDANSKTPFYHRFAGRVQN